MTDTVTTAAAPMSPGLYLQKRREASELTIDDVARMLSPAPHGQDRVRAELRLLEQHRGEPSPGMIDELRGLFAFDVEVYQALVAHAADPQSELPVPPVCRICACSWNDTCVDNRRGPCAWADGEQDLCTHCIGEAAIAAAAIRGGPGSGGIHEA